VELAAARGRRDGRDRAVITVGDQGPGFPPGFLPQAFERFSRADIGRSRAAGVPARGLAIVNFTARANHGRAAAVNRPGGGARGAGRDPGRPARASRPGRQQAGTSGHVNPSHLAHTVLLPPGRQAGVIRSADGGDQMAAHTMTGLEPGGSPGPRRGFLERAGYRCRRRQEGAVQGNY
jgi:hypothetical protein